MTAAIASNAVRNALTSAQAIAGPRGTASLPVLSRVFTPDPRHGDVVGARLVATAHGVYEARLDHEPVTASVLNPGWTSYEWRLPYQEFDVTSTFASAAADTPAVTEHRLDVVLAGGWWHGDLGFSGMALNYGHDEALLAALLITFEDGHVQTITTGPDWTATASPITLANLYDGQREDRRIDPGEPVPVRLVDFDTSVLVPQIAPPARRHEAFAPVEIWTSPHGKTLVDFGQNLVGWIRLSLPAELPEGTTITLRHAEVLERGELGTRPLRGAKATDQVTVAGGIDTVFEPTLTYHGFRYAEIAGWPDSVPLGAESLEAVAVHAAMPRTSGFECSEPLVNQLVANSVQSQEGNFLTVPTDCPQRDERLGWTGDIAAYAPTAAFQFDVSAFLHNWLLDLEAETLNSPAGLVPFVVPDLLRHAQDDGGPQDPNMQTPTAIWGDAAVWVSEALWNAYGDEDDLALHYPAMAAHVRSIEKVLSPTGLWDTGFQFGDWLDPDAPPEDAAAAKADKGVVATACLYRSAGFTADAARILGKDEDAAHWQDLADRTKAAFLEHYVSDDGTIVSDCATVYALAIHFGLLDGPVRDQPDGHVRQVAGDRLGAIVRDQGYRVSTGFAGTPYVTWALTETGHVEDAYRLLLEKECPSWLYPVTMGATTIWERWDSMLPDGDINPGEMTSFNHYALGAVADWIYQVVLGIRAAKPGYAEVVIQPVPGPGITWASGWYRSAQGKITVDWRVGDDGAFHLEAETPDGVPTTIVLPDGTRHETTSGRVAF